jgi:RNA-directed DNA polymerase
VTDKEMEGTPAAVTETPKQAGEIRARWAWTEPSIWTERMLTALEQGVKGGKWFSLMDKVYRERTLWAAFLQVKANDGAAGVDRQTVEDFERDLIQNLRRLSEQLREGSYRPQAVRRVWIPKPGSTEKRPLGVPTVRDRVVQAALRLVLEPIFERDFAEQSYGFRPNRGCKQALRRVEDLLKQEYTWIVDADLKSYFDTIPHEPLLERVRAKVSDGAVLDLVEAFLNQQVLDGMKSWTPEGGTPQGAVLTPHTQSQTSNSNRL